MIALLFRGVLEMWKTTLLKTEELGKGRGLVADMLQDSISESLKELKRRKEQQFKRHFEVAQRMICEVLDTVKDLATVSRVFGCSLMLGFYLYCALISFL